MTVCGRLGETERVITETWSAENSKQRVASVFMHRTPFTVIVGEGVLTAWYGHY